MGDFCICGPLLQHIDIKIHVQRYERTSEIVFGMVEAHAYSSLVGVN
jgi:hypothetical protein